MSLLYIAGSGMETKDYSNTLGLCLKIVRDKPEQENSPSVCKLSNVAHDSSKKKLIINSLTYHKIWPISSGQNICKCHFAGIL